MRADDKRHGTNAGYAAHRPAAREQSKRKRAKELEDIALTGGTWQPDRWGILRWVTA